MTQIDFESEQGYSRPENSKKVSAIEKILIKSGLLKEGENSSKVLLLILAIVVIITIGVLVFGF